MVITECSGKTVLCGTFLNAAVTRKMSVTSIWCYFIVKHVHRRMQGRGGKWWGGGAFENMRNTDCRANIMPDMPVLTGNYSSIISGNAIMKLLHRWIEIERREHRQSYEHSFELSMA